MKIHVRLRPQVPDDVLAIAAHLQAHRLAAALRFVNVLPLTLAELAQRPGKGSIKRLRLKLLGEVRSWRVPRYRG